jgi:hypothetical protein
MFFGPVQEEKKHFLFKNQKINAENTKKAEERPERKSTICACNREAAMA